MALEIRSTPVLTGEDAERFVREAEENKRNPQRKKLLFSFEDIDSMMERSRKYLKEHGGKGPFKFVFASLLRQDVTDRLALDTWHRGLF